MLSLTSLNRRRLLSPSTETHPRIKADSPVARSAIGYLHANCASCHSPQGRAGNYSIDYMFRFEDQINEREQALYQIIYDPSLETVRQDYKIPGTSWPQINYAVVPGRADLSQMVYRMNERGVSHQMPKIGSGLIDTQAVELVSEWINSLSESNQHLDVLQDESNLTRYEDPRRRR